MGACAFAGRLACGEAGVSEFDLENAILRALLAWGWLPETDLVRRLTPGQVVRYRREVLEKLMADGYIEVRFVGDERVIRLTAMGRRAAEGADQAL